MDFPYLCYICYIVYWREYSSCSDLVVHFAITVSTWCVPWHVAIAMSAQSGVYTAKLRWDPPLSGSSSGNQTWHLKILYKSACNWESQSLHEWFSIAILTIEGYLFFRGQIWFWHRSAPSWSYWHIYPTKWFGVSRWKHHFPFVHTLWERGKTYVFRVLCDRVGLCGCQTRWLKGDLPVIVYVAMQNGRMHGNMISKWWILKLQRLITRG
jgi:hypothetical protein